MEKNGEELRGWGDTKFWEGVWMRDASLRNLFPKLFNLRRWVTLEEGTWFCGNRFGGVSFLAGKLMF